jgi:hypothetical protein
LSRHARDLPLEIMGPTWKEIETDKSKAHKGSNKTHTWSIREEETLKSPSAEAELVSYHERNLRLHSGNKRYLDSRLGNESSSVLLPSESASECPSKAWAEHISCKSRRAQPVDI